MASPHVAALCCLILLIVAAGTGSQKSAYVRAGNYFVAARPINVTFNGSNTTSCASFRRTDWVQARLHDATLPLLATENIYTVVIDDTDVVLYLDSSLDNNTQYTINVYDDFMIWIDVTSFTDQGPPSLGIDQALFSVFNEYSHPVEYSSVSSACYKCLPSNNVTIKPGASQPIVVDTDYPLTYFLTLPNGTEVCSTSYHFTEGELTNMTVGNDGMCSPLVVTNRDLHRAFLPIAYAVGALIGVAIVWLLSYFVYMQLLSRRSHQQPTPVVQGALVDDDDDAMLLLSKKADHSNTVNAHTVSLADDAKPVAKKSSRLQSLDAFRGFSLTIMIFVNYGGGGYYFFDHSLWHGLTVADLVFPWFIWIMGVSMVFSYKGRSKDTFLSQLYQVVRRTIILFGLGLFGNNGQNVYTWRIPGVLQRFGASYLVCALTELATSYLYQIDKSFVPKHRYLAYIRDLTNNWVQWIIMVTFTFLWLMITFLLPLDNGCPRGYLGPGGLAEAGRYKTCTGGAAAKIDNWILGEEHIYQGPTPRAMYHTGPYDPEGILGTLTSIVLCFLGVQCGRILTSYQSHKERIGRFLFWGLVLGGIAAGLCGCQQNEGVIPVNKNLWSLSFILVMASFAFFLFSLFYVLCDVVRVWNGSPFRFPGMNSILVYMCSEVFQGFFPFSWTEQNDSHLKLLSANLVAVSVWVLLSYYCHCMASLYIYVYVSLLSGLAGTQSQTNTATVRAGNFVGEESVTISLNGSAVRCSGYNYTEPLTVPLQDNAAGAAAPFVIEANLFVVVYNSDIRVVLYLDSTVENNTDYAVSFYGNGSFWINVTSPGQQWSPSLGLDQALFSVFNEYPEPVEYTSVSSACYKCLPSNNVTIKPGASQPIVVDTDYPLTYFLTLPNGTEVCSRDHHFVEGQTASLTIKRARECSDLSLNDATVLQTYLPIIYAAIILVGSALVWCLVYWLYIILIYPNKHCLHIHSLDRNIAKDLGNPQKASLLRKNELDSNSVNNEDTQLSGSKSGRKKSQGRNRLLSLDAFRGFSLTIMLFVNYGGGGYYFFDHSLWHGLTVADLVFPWFIWIMGVSMVFSYKGRSKDTFLSQLYQVVRRSIILFGLGIFVNNGYHLNTWRIPRCSSEVWRHLFSLCPDRTVYISSVSDGNVLCTKTSIPGVHT
ncbi:hypothetical protein EMCRGX_G006640 [Ephydatia muelleri]